MSLCFYNASDRAVVYPYKMKLQASVVLATLYLILGLPLFILINGSLFNFRQYRVNEIAFLAESIDLSKEKTGLPVMQFDDTFDAGHARNYKY